VVDYGEHDLAAPTPAEAMPWAIRPDPFSSYRATFEVRTYRLCRRVLMFHRFAELGATPCLVRSTDFTYADARVRSPDGTFDQGRSPATSLQSSRPAMSAPAPATNVRLSRRSSSAMRSLLSATSCTCWRATR